MDIVRYAKYEADSQDVITKDGHAMFPNDIARELNRKSYLEKENKLMREVLELSRLLLEVEVNETSDEEEIRDQLSEALSKLEDE